MQQLLETWWYGYIVIPLGITVFIGGLLAIWIGVFIARRVAFDQARLSACHALYKMAELADSRSKADYSDRLYKISQALLIANSQALCLRQDGLCSFLQFVFVRLNESPWKVPDSFPLNGQERRVFIESIQPWTKIWSQMIFNVTPRLYALFTVQRQVTSKYTVHCIPFKKMVAFENTAREAVERHQREREKAYGPPAKAANESKAQ